MLRKTHSHIFLILSISLFLLVAIGNHCLAATALKDERFEVIYQSNFTPLKEVQSKSAEDGIRFTKLFLENYSMTLYKEVNLAPREEYLLWKSKGIGVKVVISTFNESLLYFFPNESNQIFVDGINFPVQTALLYDFIDLNNPTKVININKAYLKVPFDEAVRQYNAEQGRIHFTDSGGWFFIIGRGGLAFNNVNKMFSLHEKLIVGVMAGTLEIVNSNPLFVQIHGNSDPFKFNLQGPLLFSSENTFSWAFEVAAKLGKEFAELEIKDLFTKSEFFLLSIADKKLRPKAEDILRKKSRSDKDKSFEYPLWEFKRDKCELMKMAQLENVNSSYIDELLECKALLPVDGHFMWYYSDALGFMWQWLFFNGLVLTFLLLLRFGRYRSTPIFVYIITRLPPPRGKISFVLLLLGINGAIILKIKPASVSLIYWILPGAALIASLAFWINLTSIAQRYYDTQKISGA